MAFLETREVSTGGRILVGDPLTTRWQQLKCFLEFSPRSLGKWSNLMFIFFKWVGSTTTQPKIGVFQRHRKELFQALREALEDAQAGVRTAARNCFWAFEGKFQDWRNCMLFLSSCPLKNMAMAFSFALFDLLTCNHKISINLKCLDQHVVNLYSYEQLYM